MELTNRPSRRVLIRSAFATAAGVLVGRGHRAFAAPDGPAADRHSPLSAEESLQDLLAGNERFVAGRLESPRRSPDEFAALAEGQFPHALILGCADSRVSPELLFDQGVGDLFVVRVAGNVVGGTGAVVKGSIEYAVAELNVPLIMVLGHSNCGAVKAAVKHINDKDALPGAINGLVELIKPAVAKVEGQPGDKLANAIRANVQLGVERLSGLEPILAGPVREGRVKIVGATYDLRTGRVEIVT